MFKKILVTSLIFLSSSSFAFGPYVGASAGVVTNTSTATSSLEIPATFRGLSGTLFAGYGDLVNPHIYLGGEIFVVPGIAQLSNSDGSAVKTTHGYGISFLPGLAISEHTWSYVRMGYIRTHFKREHTNVNGAQLGIGLQTSLTRHVDIRSEYVFTGYDTFHHVKTPRADQFNIGVSYRFL